jgi:hypothetical protein
MRESECKDDGGRGNHDDDERLSLLVALVPSLSEQVGKGKEHHDCNR